ncbi:MAG: Re/Si-specific NAD(P)(+) transhydrogenase subunit alpha [Polyangiaceae bacterium]|nr:Re/Si-specific NAD(P)(+) transhydrogenase subunit alpha [Polyangiaceae bacterium]
MKRYSQIAAFWLSFASAMRVGVLTEQRASEKRVSIVPDSVKRLAQKKIEIVVEKGAGAKALASDADYEKEGAKVVSSAADVLQAADVVMRVQVPSQDEVSLLREGSVLVAPLVPLVNHDLVRSLAARKITALALDAIPRTTLAQMMDVLSSQATAAGYHAVVLAATALPRFLPMLITAAGTIAPATLLVLGAGVAGLSAIGTGRRLGARVEAFDVRKVAKEQVESLGAKFVEVDADADAEAAGGYAKEVSDAYKAKQAEVLARHVARADAIICTALIPGKRAPVLVTEDMVASMKPGSVIVDLAAEQGGNCALTEAGKTVTKHGVNILGAENLPSQIAVHASQMWSRNMEKFLLHVSKGGELQLNDADEIVRGCLITQGGEIVNDRVRDVLGLAKLERLAKKEETAKEDATKGGAA